MRRLVMTLAVYLLACAGTIPVSAQEPSPLVPPPPWVGGERVEMPEHGIALTVPSGWVAFDLTVDVVSQLEAVESYVGPGVYDPVHPDLVADAASQGIVLVLGDALSANGCDVGLVSWPLDKLDMLADAVADAFADDPSFRDVEPLQPLDLPAGPAYLIRWSQQSFKDESWPDEGRRWSGPAGAQAPADIADPADGVAPAGPRNALVRSARPSGRSPAHGSGTATMSAGLKVDIAQTPTAARPASDTTQHVSRSRNVLAAMLSTSGWDKAMAHHDATDRERGAAAATA